MLLVQVRNTDGFTDPGILLESITWIAICVGLVTGLCVFVSDLLVYKQLKRKKHLRAALGVQLDDSLFDSQFYHWLLVDYLQQADAATCARFVKLECLLQVY